MLKKLVSALALTSLAFGSGLCFDPYNHDYGVNERNIPGYGVQFIPQSDRPVYAPNEELVLHNGKNKDGDLKLIKYVVKGNKALVLMESENPMQTDLLFYVECVNGKPETKAIDDAEAADHEFITNQTMGFYKNGFFFKYLDLVWGPTHYDCGYVIDYYPYKLIKEHKTDHIPHKYKSLPTRVCNALGKKFNE